MARKIRSVCILIVMAMFVLTPFALAQEPERGEVVLGRAYDPSIDVAVLTTDFAELDSECSELPLEWLDHFGMPVDQVHPEFPETDDAYQILEWAGIEIDRSQGCEKVQPGQTYLGLVAVEGRCGSSAIIPHVQNQAGDPLANVLVAFRWPGMGDANQCTAAVKPNPFGECVLGWTDGGGSVGFGIGQGGFINPPNGGPFSTWGTTCLHEGCIYGKWYGADIFGGDGNGTGWFGGTDHCVFNPIFAPSVRGGNGGQLPSDLGIGYWFEDKLVGVAPLETHGTPDGDKGSIVVVDKDETVLGYTPLE